MFKYIVTYVIITITYIPCPKPEPTKDEFGRTTPFYIQTTEACWDTDTTKMQKEFIERKLAIEFIERGKADKAQGYMPYMGSGELSNFKLDSVKIKKGLNP